MNPLTQVALGLQSYFRGISFIFKHRLWWFFLFPLGLNIALFAGGVASVDVIIESVMELIEPWINFKDQSFWGAEFITEYLPGVLHTLLWLIMKVLFFFLFAWFGGQIVLILMSPVLAVLSERTEQILTGNEYPFNAVQPMRDTIRGVKVAVRNLFIEIGWSILLFFFAFVPVVGLSAPFLGFMISSFFYGFSYMDYYSERRRMKVVESIRFIRKHKFLAMANGATFSLCLLIPFCGVTIAGFAAIISCVGATLTMHHLLDVKKVYTPEAELLDAPPASNKPAVQNPEPPASNDSSTDNDPPRLESKD